jgi:hypothetical protein
LQVNIPTSDLSGKIRREFVILTDSPNPSLKELLLTLRADIRVRFRVIPSSINFGEIAPGKPHLRQFRLITGLDGLAESFRMVLSNNKNVLPKLVRRQPGLLTFEVRLAQSHSPEDMNAEVMLLFDHPEVREVPVDVLASIREQPSTVERLSDKGDRPEGE